MRRKQILIGLFAFIIYRTIGEPKKPQGGRERAFVDTCFLRPATAGTGILGVVFARPATAGTGANGLMQQVHSISIRFGQAYCDLYLGTF